MIGIACDYGQIGARRSIRLGAALLPVAQCAERDAIAGGKLFLRQIQSAADDLRTLRPFHAPEVRGGEGLCVGSARAAFSIASEVIGLGILFEILVLLMLRCPPRDPFEPLFHGSTGNQ